MTMTNYLKQVQFLMHDQRIQHLNPSDLVECINSARREIAIRTECIRILTPITGRITALSIASVGSGYTSPTLVIPGPDYPSNTPPYPNGLQATASIAQTGGSISSVLLTYGGEGYWQPVLSISDPTGTGASVLATTSGAVTTNAGQEVYPLSAVDMTLFPGVDSIYSVKSISILFGNYRYSLPCYSFSSYQAFLRQYSLQFTSTPTVCAQFGRGSTAILYLYPIPDQAYQLELDCYCLPLDLTVQMTGPDVIPNPLSHLVQYIACVKACESLREYNAARYYSDKAEKLFKSYVPRVNVSRWTNMYGRY